MGKPGFWPAVCRRKKAWKARSRRSRESYQCPFSLTIRDSWGMYPAGRSAFSLTLPTTGSLIRLPSRLFSTSTPALARKLPLPSFLRRRAGLPAGWLESRPILHRLLEVPKPALRHKLADFQHEGVLLPFAGVGGFLYVADKGPLHPVGTVEGVGFQRQVEGKPGYAHLPPGVTFLLDGQVNRNFPAAIQPTFRPVVLAVFDLHSSSLGEIQYNSISILT